MVKRSVARAARRWLVGGAIGALLLAVPAIVFSVPLQRNWVDGSRLTAADLNANFSALNNAKLEVGNVTRVSVEFPESTRPNAANGGIGIHAASCPGSKVLVGGGCFTNAFFLTVIASGPSVYEANGWYCGFSNPSGFLVSAADQINIIASAICIGP